MASQQYAFRAQRFLGLVAGTPTYTSMDGFAAPDEPARTYHYSPDGRLFAYALPTLVRIYLAEGAHVLRELDVQNTIELKFSPRGTYLSTWERPVKLDDGSQHKNLRVFSTSTGQELISFTQKSLENWDIQYTISESHAIRLVAQEIQVYRPADWGKGIVDKLRVEGASTVSLSPGLKPSVAVFVAEKKGAAASVKIYGLSTLSKPPTCSKAFYKADRAQIKWNDLGTQVLILTQTEVDNTNMSYYGETGMYLLSAAGNYSCLVTLDKEGPIHDVCWSPNSKEFGVVYGFMPARSTLFDQSVKPLYDFGSSPHNYISYNPQGRLVALAGFGNLAGKIDIIDRTTLKKICTIDAPNTSFCEWSPCGRFLLTATLSPRLRVDNGIKVWHCTGGLMHVQLVDELYQASWRPTPLDHVPPFGQAIPAAPQPSISVLTAALTAKSLATKPAGAYRPPGARGLATPTIFKREDEGGAARLPTGSGSATPPRRSNNNGSLTYSNGNGNQIGNNGRQRLVPGAAPKAPSAAPSAEKKKKKGKKGEKGAGEVGEGSGAATPTGEASVRPSMDVQVIMDDPQTLGPGSVPPTPCADSLDPVAKKVRNLNKKLKAIEELKEKAHRGDSLEVTQLKKIGLEAEIRKELSGLGFAASAA